MKRCNSVLTLLSTALVFSPLLADEPHSHEPIMLRSRPVIERVPVKVVKPVDVIVNSLNETLIADDVGRCLLRVDVNGNATSLGDNLRGISRVVDSPQLGVYALLADSKSGRILNFTDNGHQMQVVYFKFRPTGLAIDHTGNLITANNSRREIVRTDGEGRQEVIGRVRQTVRDLAVDEIGNTVLLLSNGQVATMTSGETADNIGYVPPTSTRLAVHPDGKVIALSHVTGKTCLVNVSDDREATNRFAAVPHGTSAFAFDSLGNLTLANPDLQAITRVNSHFEISCPHCGKPVSMIMSPNAPPARQPQLRSF